MRIIDFRPELTPFKDGQTLRAGSSGAWKAIDERMPGGHRVRHIFHYETFMGFYEGVAECFTPPPAAQNEWEFYPESIGHGSVSDQGGMNDLMGFRVKWENGSKMYRDYGYVYHRDQRGGGPRIVRVIDRDTREVVCD